MPDHAIHPDLAAHALAGLPPAEARAVEAHVAECLECRRELERLRATAALLEQAAPPYEVPAGLEERTMQALARGSVGPRRARDRPRLRAAVTVSIAAAAAIAGILIGVRAADEPSPAGRLELTATLRSPTDPQIAASVIVRATSLGRDVSIRSSTLAVLPKGEFYELWFVGPGDSTTDPDRISAGTFHPDEQGRTDLHLHAAVDPSLFPTMSVTAEIGDGDPSPGREIIRFSR